MSSQHPRKDNVISFWGLLDAAQAHRPAASASIPLVGVKCSCLLLNTLAEVTIRQRYKNTSSNPIQAIYVFPVDDQAAVNAFTAQLGERTVRGVIQPKDEARKTYQTALDEGHGAALLETEGEGALSVRLGNLAPGSEAEICLVYSSLCRVEDNGVVLKVPTTIKQRYVPAELLPSDRTEQPTYRSDIEYGLSLEAEFFMPGRITSVASSTHPLKVLNDPDDACHSKATLGVKEVAMDGDVIIRVEHTKLRKPHVFLCSQPDVDNGSAGVMLTFVPEFEGSNEETSGTKGEEQEFVFLVDCSGSMGHGGRGHASPIAQCCDALQLFLRSLPEGCLFNIVGFGSSFKKLFDTSRVYDKSSLDEATRHVSRLSSNMGGTEILRPLQDILSNGSKLPDFMQYYQGYKARSSMRRTLFLLTDGAVGNTHEVIQTVKENAGNTRIFSFGVGEGAAADLVNGVARAGRGEACFIRRGESIDEMVIAQLSKAMEPALEDLHIHWGVLALEEQSPSSDSLPPIFNNTPYTVFGLLKKESQHQGQVVLSGKLNGKERYFRVDITPWTTSRTDCHILHSLAAKHMIRDLQEKGQGRGLDVEVKKKVLSLSTRFSVASSEASFIAVEEREELVKGVMTTVRVPLSPVEKTLPLQDSLAGSYTLACSPATPWLNSAVRTPFPPTMGACFPAPVPAPTLRSFQSSLSRGSSMPGSALQSNVDPFDCGSEDLACFSYSTLQEAALPPHVQPSFQSPAMDLLFAGGGPPSLPDPAPRVRRSINSVPASCCMINPADQAPAASLWSYDTHTVTSSTGTGLSQDPLQSLASLQAANGSWQLDDTLARAVQLSLKSIEAAQPADLTDSPSASSLWATAIALAYLLEKCAQRRTAFSLMEKKAKKWMANESSSPKAEQLILSARTLF